MTDKCEVRSYSLKLRGEPGEDFLNSFCPAGTVLELVGEDTLLTNICTDQSGILGLIRYLHNIGITILELKA